ncbi:MAG: 1,4-dihydroxy-6-naphthoate synthase [Bacteroidetes bacterium]|nr:MAG: 1,4-dihydroxy-6-naphthoate synthase [Bacteroidota bacterium]
MKLTLGFSPCPNDTFIFDSLVNHKMNTEGLEFDVVLEDVQTLNKYALEGKLDISKISYGVLPLVLNDYILLNSGGALGKGAGPLLISKNEFPAEKVDDSTVAVPGENTTANMLFSLAFPRASRKKFMVFSEIEDAVLKNEVDCGVIIHENRFTYQKRGLSKVVDLGEYWEQQTNAPIPLGGIVVRRNIDPKIRKQVDKLIRQSLEISFQKYPSISEYVKEHSQEMEENVMRQHIDLYVNDYSLNLGRDGRAAVEKFLEIYALNRGKKLSLQNVFSDEFLT